MLAGRNCETRNGADSLPLGKIRELELEHAASDAAIKSALNRENPDTT